MTVTPRNLTFYEADNDLLQERIILVTGAGDGIGQAAALAFADCGATLILAGRTVPKLEAVYDLIVDNGRAEPAIYPVDLRGATEADYADLAQHIDNQFGRLDGLLHNAGELGPRTPLSNYKLDSWETVMHVNVTAPFMLTRALLPVLEKSRDASVLFTSSGVGRKGKAHWGAYSVSKFATEGLSQVWAAEVKGVAPIRINCINPGATRTKMRATAYPGEDPNKLKTPEQIMPAYLYLMGPDSKGVSGESFDAQ